jgi:hypothetical protein
MTQTKVNNKGDLRVWWIPQVPMQPFYVPVKDIKDAKLILDTLARYDLFQFKNHIKPDYSNAGGLQVYSDDIDDEETSGWEEWENENGENIDEVEV